MLLQIHFVYLLLPFCTLNVLQMYQSDVIMYGDISLLTLNIFFHSGSQYFIHKIYSLFNGLNIYFFNEWFFAFFQF